MIDVLTDLLAIPSPTFKETAKVTFIRDYLTKHCPEATLDIYKDNLVATFGNDPTRKTLALVGHSDVVPKHVSPRVEHGRVYGSGASDMQAAVAVFLDVLREHQHTLAYNIKLIIYAREEGTALHENGLHDLIHDKPEIMATIDCAIVGEPTDNTIQLGCLGSLHMAVTVAGKAAHSARPWHGENALYKALPIITQLAATAPEEVMIKGLRFKEVMSITQLHCGTGRTTVPGECRANINYRYAPNKSLEEAETYLRQCLTNCAVADMTLEVVDNVPSGSIIDNEVTAAIIAGLKQPIQAKQAWTDVAQLAQCGIACFNFGPGYQAQAHQVDEYVGIELMQVYRELLVGVLKG